MIKAIIITFCFILLLPSIVEDIKKGFEAYKNSR